MSDYAFMVTQIGDKGSAERRRADEISDYVVIPALQPFGLSLKRADRDPTPVQVTPQILRDLIGARVVIADLTGRNPNVYYELAIAHSFTRPVIHLVDEPQNVAFDTKDERLITIGRCDGMLGAAQADELKVNLTAALKVVMSDEFRPSSLVTEVATALSIDDLAPDNPVAAELAALRESLEEIRKWVTKPQYVQSPSLVADRRELYCLIERFVENGHASVEAFDATNPRATSDAFIEWHTTMRNRVVELRRESEQADPWATPSPAASSSANGGWGGGSYSDDPPF